MNAFTLIYHENAKKDISHLDEAVKCRIRLAIETRLGTAPDQYGMPLHNRLKGFRKLRVGDYRVVFEITKREVRILRIGHRKDVYKA